ncbi:MAG: hypothetical protein J6T54_04275 [Fibrobacter sp.]|nr:hypothetical protein [Fibrobacter sp.]
MRFDPGKALVVKRKHDVDVELVRQEILAGRFDGDEVKKWRTRIDDEERIRADIMSASAKNITIRMQLDDLNGIKKMAKAAGMPYQTLINSIIHRYVTGGIVFKVAV